MKFKPVSLVLFMFLLFGCSSSTSTQKENWIKEILETEEAFSNLSVKEGLAKAFAEYAADDVVINRNDSLIFGKDGLMQFYSQATNPSQKVELSWKPDFADVSESGDLAYTFGKYLFTVSDSTGNIQSSTGIFHTVWKRQSDGSWRFVWD